MLGQYKPDANRDERKRVLDWQEAPDQLERLGNFWSGSNVSIEKSTIIPPGGVAINAGIVINRKNLPNIEIRGSGSLAPLKWSVRSFYAQVGIDIVFFSGNLNDIMIKSINDGNDVIVPVIIENYGQREVELNGEVMRFFWVNEKKRLRGDDLLNILKSGELIIGGEEGKDWRVAGYEPDGGIEQIGEIPDRVEYIEVRLSDKKLYVPHSSQPIRRDESMPIREQLSGLLTEIPKEKNISFEIGETPHIRLSKDIAAVIVMGVDDESKKHINSALLDPGSNWPIRTETNGRDYIDLLIYRVKDSV